MSTGASSVSVSTENSILWELSSCVVVCVYLNVIALCNDFSSGHIARYGTVSVPPTRPLGNRQGMCAYVIIVCRVKL